MEQPAEMMKLICSRNKSTRPLLSCRVSAEGRGHQESYSCLSLLEMESMHLLSSSVVKHVALLGETPLGSQFATKMQRSHLAEPEYCDEMNSVGDFNVLTCLIPGRW